MNGVTTRRGGRASTARREAMSTSARRSVVAFAILTLTLIMSLSPAAPATGAAGAAGAAEDDVYIVRHEAPSLAQYRGGVSGLAPTSPEVTGAVRLDPGTAA